MDLGRQDTRPPDVRYHLRVGSAACCIRTSPPCSTTSCSRGSVLKSMRSPSPTARARSNLTSLARRIQAALDALESVSADELSRPNIVEESGFRIVWHARERRAGEEADPVIV